MGIVWLCRAAERELGRSGFWGFTLSGKGCMSFWESWVSFFYWAGGERDDRDGVVRFALG